MRHHGLAAVLAVSVATLSGAQPDCRDPIIALLASQLPRPI
jgi:hypothetical protein